jgi:hypothetical protein
MKIFFKSLKMNKLIFKKLKKNNLRLFIKKKLLVKKKKFKTILLSMFAFLNFINILLKFKIKKLLFNLEICIKS